CAVEFAIARQAKIPPIREWRVDPEIEYREDLVQVLLDDRAVRLECIEVDTESELGGDIDRETHQFPAQVDRLTPIGGFLPAVQETLGGRVQLGIKGLQMRRIQRHGDDFALPAPIVALRR